MGSANPARQLFVRDRSSVRNPTQFGPHAHLECSSLVCERNAKLFQPTGEVLLELAGKLLDVGAGPGDDGPAETPAQRFDVGLHHALTREFEDADACRSRADEQPPERTFQHLANDAVSVPTSAGWATERSSEGITEAAG